MKKIIFLTLICLLVFFGGISAMAISEGDCVVAGEYNGKPILWRCAEVSDDGIYLISENVLFNHKYNSASSNLWSTSEIRSYLNDEFLGDCLGKESKYIIEKDIKTISATQIDNEQHIYNNGFEYAVQNAGNAYSITTKDRIFLPSIEEVQTFYKNIALYGSDFYMGKDFNGNYVDYYLRDSVSFENQSKYVRCISSEIDIYYISETYYDRLIRSVPVDTDGIGIRPAFYISADTPLIKGDGSINNPYEIPVSYFCEVRFDKDVFFQGTYIIPDIMYSLSEEGQYIKYYCNNKEYDLNEECMIGYGENTFYAVLYNSAGEALYVSEQKTVSGFTLDPGTNRLFMDFEGDNPLSGFKQGYSAADGDTIDVVNVDGEHKNVLRFNAHTTNTFANTQSFKEYQNILIIESDIMLHDWNFSSRPVFYLAVNKDSKKLWMSPIMIYPDGKLIFDDGSGTNVIRDDIALDKWYKMTLVYDVSKNRVSFLIDDEICVYNSQTPLNFDYIDYINLGYKTNGQNSEMYYDNIRVSTSKQDMTGSRYGIPYYNTRDIKNYDFSDNTYYWSESITNENTYFKNEPYDTVRGNAAHVRTAGTDKRVGISPRNDSRKIFSRDTDKRYGAWVMEFEFNVTKCDGNINYLGGLTYMNSDGKEFYWTPLHFNNKGEMYISKDIDFGANNSESKVKVKEFTLNNWHKVRYLIDTENLIIYIYFDGILYAEVDCDRSVNNKAFSVEKSRDNCYFEFQADSPGKSGLVNEFYVDNISFKGAKSLTVYNVMYINGGKRIFNKDQITDFSSLKIKADIKINPDMFSPLDIKAITSAILSTGELDTLSINDVVEYETGFCGAEMELTNISPEIKNGEITTMFWEFDTLTPVSEVVIFN